MGPLGRARCGARRLRRAAGGPHARCRAGAANLRARLPGRRDLWPARAGPGAASVAIVVALRVDSIAARVAAASAVPAICGLVVGVVMPRGPLTTGQSLVALGLAVVTGAAAGWLLRSRWSVVLAPVVFAVAFELTRVGADGPTVDGISFDGLYAVIAFVVGRGFDGLVIGLPMVVGALWGAALRRRSRVGTPGRPGRAGRVVRRVGLGLATAFVVLLAAALARPASTAPVVDAAGEPLPGSIAELVTVDVGGHAQSVMLRGRDATAPVLLFLEGGPGGTALGSMRHAGSGLEDHFVVATWDQRGTGKSAIAREPVETLTVDQAVRDTIEVVDYLRDRFDESRVYLVGSSWGTTLGTLVVQERPDLFHAYIGSGQMVDQQETDKVMYADTLAYARRVGNQSLADRLVANGPPPYTDMLAYPVALSSNRDWGGLPARRRLRPRLDVPGEPVRAGVLADGAGPRHGRDDGHLRRDVSAAPGHRLPPRRPSARRAGLRRRRSLRGAGPIGAGRGLVPHAGGAEEGVGGVRPLRPHPAPARADALRPAPRGRRAAEHVRRGTGRDDGARLTPGPVDPPRTQAAEDRGFEPLRDCSQHAFQACALGH